MVAANRSGVELAKNLRPQRQKSGRALGRKRMAESSRPIDFKSTRHIPGEFHGAACEGEEATIGEAGFKADAI